MPYIYIDALGAEHGLEGLDDLVNAVRSGRISATMLLRDAHTSLWRPAAEHDIFVAAVRLAGNPPMSPPPDTGGASAPVRGDDSGVTGHGRSTPPHHDGAVQALPTIHSPKKHGFRGQAYMILTYIGAAVSVVAAIAVLAIGVEDGAIVLGLLSASVLAIIAAAGVVLAQKIAKFSDGARLVALALQYVVLGSGVVDLFRGGPLSAIHGSLIIGVSMAFIHYFHTHRHLFQVQDPALRQASRVGDHASLSELGTSLLRGDLHERCPSCFEWPSGIFPDGTPLTCLECGRRYRYGRSGSGA